MSQVRDEVEANPLIDGSRGPVSAGVAFDVERTVKRELLDEVRRSWLAGSPLEPEDALRRWPTDPRDDPDVASLLLEDYLQRSSRGEPLTAEHYTQRFPQHKDSLDRLVRANEFLRSLGTCPSTDQGLRLPELNEELFGFHLRHELGRGAFARVYLAEQKDLAGRPVVLKVSGIEGCEPQTLAQLQHTHIVPIFSVHENPRAGLRALCMPYFGGASLSHVLQRLWKATTRPQGGRELLRALEEVAAPAPADLIASEQGPRSTLGQLSYIGTAAWIVARLAEGLQHAHQRGVLHRDIKPSNILLGADGQPLLLDFNLAQDCHDATQATLGGTIAYMAPEHLRALATRDPALAKTIDHRADIYSLGMVLYEMLAGRSPFEQSASYTPLPLLVEAMALERSRKVPSLRAIRPDVSWSLESISQR
jgi:serine/threonine protein kinase